MKRLAALLFICVCIFGCDEMQKPLMDIVDEVVAPEPEPFADVPRITASDALSQDKITGPWLWMVTEIPTKYDDFETISADLLMDASDGAVSEIDVATNGVASGDSVGTWLWTLETIAVSDEYGYGGNVYNLVHNKIGFGRRDISYLSAYALINIVSNADRPNLTMRVGSDDSIKVWLNGKVVHKYAANRPARDFKDRFNVGLKKGDNLLLVKVNNHGGGWTLFVGIEDPLKPTDE